VPLPGGRLIETWRPGRSGAPNATGKTAKQREGHGGAHLRQQTAQRAAVAALSDGAAPLGSGDGGGSTWGSSGSKKVTGCFAMTSSFSSRLQLQRAAVNRWRTTAARVWFLRIKIR
jgi:hypothetical protein